MRLSCATRGRALVVKRPIGQQWTGRRRCGAGKCKWRDDVHTCRIAIASSSTNVSAAPSQPRGDSGGRGVSRKWPAMQRSSHPLLPRPMDEHPSNATQHSPRREVGVDIMSTTPVDASCILEAAGDAPQWSRLPCSEPPVTRETSPLEFVEPSICHEPILVAGSGQQRVWLRRQPCTVFPWDATGGADRASTRKVGTVRTPLQSARALSDQARMLIFRRGRESVLVVSTRLWHVTFGLIGRVVSVARGSCHFLTRL